MSFYIKKYEVNIKLLSGMHIGAGDTEMKIGGVDNKTVKNPADDMPYIPGSSLKGKVRSLLEYSAGIQKQTDGRPFSAKDMGENTEINTIVKLFGCGAGDSDAKAGVTRLSFADAHLSAEDKKRDTLFEIKAETAIDRKSGTAQGGSLRFTERVISGIVFNASISMRVFDGDDEADFENTLLKGLKLLSYDAIGGAGSRGYGRVELSFADPALQEKFDSIEI